jgi:hypothetical protein
LLPSARAGDRKRFKMPENQLFCLIVGTDNVPMETTDSPPTDRARQRDPGASDEVVDVRADHLVSPLTMEHHHRRDTARSLMQVNLPTGLRNTGHSDAL